MLQITNYRPGRCRRCEEHDQRLVVDVTVPGSDPEPVCFAHLADLVKATCKPQTEDER